MKLIACENASFAYEGKVVVENVNFEIVNGDYLCIIGANGAGKSTLIKGLLKLKKAHSGKLIINSKHIGYLAQINTINKDFPANVYEVVLSGNLKRMGLRPFYSAKEKANASRFLEKLGISHLAAKSFNDLSGGQKQRVLLARALVASDDVLILDEPFANLDPMITSELYETLKILNQEGLTIIMVSHDVKNALKYASKVLYLDKHQKFFGPINEYLTSDCQMEV